MARAGSRDLLAEYKAKRDFGKTPEPGPKRGKAKGNSFVIQKHAARRTHFDFRLEHDGVLKSWAVTRGPSLDPAQKRLAVMTEDHPLEYGGFEGVIPKGEYGGGPVMIWDEGTWEPIGDPDEGLAKGDLKFRLHGHRLNGDYVLVRMKPRKEDRGRQNWLLIKKRDDYAGEGNEPTEEFDTSVKSGRTMDQILNGDSAIWTSNKAQKKTPAARKRAATAKPKHGKTKAKKVARALIPQFVAPELATLDTEVPTGRDWLHEVKYDGYRIIARKAGDDITLFSRSGLDWTVRFPAIAEALLSLPANIALIDGEAAFVLPSGITDFKSLQEHIDTPNPAIRYFVFDLLALDGKDWRKKPLKERRAQLAKLLAAKGVSDFLIYADYVEGSGPEFFAQACAAGLEGIVSKRADRPYISGRGKDWLKIKCLRGEEFVIGGYSRSDVKGKPFSSLLLGTFEDGTLAYSGKVGTGFDAADFDRLARKFKPLERASSPFAEVPREERKGAVWLEPKLVAQIAFTERTRDGRLRHPSFKGLREDKPAREVHREDRDGEEAGMATTRRCQQQDRWRRHLRRHHAQQSRQDLLSGHRPHQARRRPLLRERCALHAALRRATADQPGALPGWNRRATFLPAPRHEGHEQAPSKKSRSPAARARSNISISTTRRGCSGWCRSARSRSTIGACRSTTSTRLTGWYSISIPTKGCRSPR